MARISYGNAVHKRAKQLLAALLLYANDELDDDNGVMEAPTNIQTNLPATLEGLRSHIQVRWLTRTRLVVRTKVRYLQILSGLTGETQLNSDQIKEAIKRWDDFLHILEDNRPTKGGSENWHFTLNLWCDRNDINTNLRRFDQEWELKREAKGTKTEAKIPLVPVSDSQPTDKWKNICRQTLEAQNQRRLTTNPLTCVDGVSFTVDQVYVPLGLVERKQRERRSGEITAVEGSQLYEAEEGEITQTFSATEFLEQVLKSNQHQRLAIIGEPGAGKTTLLQKIAVWVLDNTEDLPIWVSLADLQAESLETYLLNNWLRVALRQRHVPREIETDFCTQFSLGKVWLLLDAVDEMAIASSYALTKIASYLTGWVGNAKVVLTCRLNVWDTGKNALENFQTYRNLNFSYGFQSNRHTLSNTIKPDQVGLFIRHWFSKNPELANNLRTELDRPERRRIKDAVKNPLRLALLCRTWGLGQGELPQTKAMLYEQFVETIYAWKQDRFPTTATQRQQLNQALGKLAFQAMLQEKTKFRLNSRFISQVLGQSDPEMLELALQLGWLNHVGITETTGEQIYAFYHPTFQEYFAALAIDNWQFFLDFQPTVPNSPKIFDLEWREVILLWLGRDDISQADKEAFIQALITWQDGCGGFYNYQAYFLAAIAIAEFADCAFSQGIISQLIKWRFGYFHPDYQRWWSYPSPIIEGARVALLKSDRKLAIAALEEFVQTSPNHFATWNAAYSLGRAFDPGNQIAIQTLEKLVNTLLRYENLRWQAASSLGKIDPGNAIAIDALVEIINFSPKDSIRRKAAFSLGKIDSGHPIAISTLEQVITNTDNHKLKHQIAENLQIIDPNNQLSQQILSAFPPDKESNNQLKSTQNQNSPREISALIQTILTSPDEEAKRRRAYRLAKADPGNEIALSTLIYLVKSAQTPTVRKRSADNLKRVLLNEQVIPLITALKTCFSPSQINELEQEKYREGYKLLWHCTEKINYSQFYQAWQ